MRVRFSLRAHIMHKVIVIAGPTAVGKTSRSIKLAHEIDGEIISADSRQVYRGIDLLSGKVTKDEMSGIPHYMLDIADPKETYSVAEYQKKGRGIIEDIISRDKTPIIVGGTGFYIHTLLFDVQLPEVPPNEELRNELNTKSLEELQVMLQGLDSDRYETIDTENKVRLIRAIEIAQTLGSVPKQTDAQPLYDITWEVLDLPDEELKEKISIRLKERTEEGMIEEAEKLHNDGVSYERLESLGLECRSTARYLQGIISKEEMTEELERDIWRYVKRQRTWLKKYASK